MHFYPSALRCNEQQLALIADQALEMSPCYKYLEGSMNGELHQSTLTI